MSRVSSKSSESPFHAPLSSLQAQGKVPAGSPNRKGAGHPGKADCCHLSTLPLACPLCSLQQGTKRDCVCRYSVSLWQAASRERLSPGHARVANQQGSLWMRQGPGGDSSWDPGTQGHLGWKSDPHVLLSWLPGTQKSLSSSSGSFQTQGASC